MSIDDRLSLEISTKSLPKSFGRDFAMRKKLFRHIDLGKMKHLFVHNRVDKSAVFKILL